jgi:NitT/TauT family transport system substrate-binding protein
LRRLAALAFVVSATAALAVASSVGAAPSAHAGKSAVSGQRFKMIIQGSPDPSKVVEVHAVNLLKKLGVDASISYNPTSSNVAIAQLMSGDADVFSNAVAGGYGAAVAGVPVVCFALLEPRQDYTFISRPDNATMASLRGKKIGVLDTSSINYPQALIALKTAKMDQHDVSIVTAGGQSSRLAALIAGRVDATMLSHLSWLKVQSQGYHLLYDYTKQASGLYDDTGWATASWLSSHRELAVDFNKALLQSYVWFDNPKNVNAVVNEAIKLSPASDPAQVKQLFDILRSNHAYPKGQILNIPTLKYEAALFEQLGTVKGHKPVGTWANVYYGKAAKKALYPPKKKK